MKVLKNEIEKNNHNYLHVTRTNSKGYSSYHDKQFQEIKRSTVKFYDWIESLNILSSESTIHVADVGAGQGANVLYASKRYPEAKFTGIDINPDLIKKGNRHIERQTNCRLLVGDLYNFDQKHIGAYEGIVSLQVLPFLPDYEIPIQKMIELSPTFIAMSALLYDGDVECNIKMHDFSEPHGRTFNYNTYSLLRIIECFYSYGYRNVNYSPFEIDIDIPKPKSTGMGTYTENLENGRRIQISGPLLMNWYFFVACKS